MKGRTKRRDASFLFATVAQLEEHPPCKRKVGGSTPSGGSKKDKVCPALLVGYGRTGHSHDRPPSFYIKVGEIRVGGTKCELIR